MTVDMHDISSRYDEIKRKLRKLKKLEIRIRFGNTDKTHQSGAVKLIWDSFFDLHEVSKGKAKYSIHDLAAMNKEDYRNVMDEFFFHVYYRFYKETGILDTAIFDPDILSHLGLSLDADSSVIKKKFRELALKYHPDTGGDAGKFIDLMDNYRKLIGKGT